MRKEGIQERHTNTELLSTDDNKMICKRPESLTASLRYLFLENTFLASSNTQITLISIIFKWKKRIFNYTNVNS